MLAASGLQMTLPPWLAFGPHWLLPALEIGLLSALVASSPGRLERRSAALRAGGLALAGLLSLTNATFAILLVGDLARGVGPRSAAALLLAGGALWTANVLIFALWYWELDRGGPADRCNAVRMYPTSRSRSCSSPAWPRRIGGRPSPTTSTCRSPTPFRSRPATWPH